MNGRPSFRDTDATRFVRSWGRCVLIAKKLEARGVAEPPESRERREVMADLAARSGAVDWKQLADMMTTQEGHLDMIARQSGA